jgi:Cys-rich protein (TIGR01571 family)
MCPQVLMGQILARMKLKHWPFAQDSDNNDKRKQSTQNMRKLVFFLVFVSVYDAWTATPLIELTIDENGGIVFEQPREAIDATASNTSSVLWHQLLYLFLTLPMTLYGVIVLVKLRAAVRDKYGIPTGPLGRMEDFMYACFCNCCILSQMARQTADYDDEPASCCSPNGMKRRYSNPSSTTSTECSDDLSSIHEGPV